MLTLPCYVNPTESTSLTLSEQKVVALVNGSRAYGYDLELEKIALKHYAFRSAGSAGATEAADWIVGQFASFGLKVEKEEFQFTTWDLLGRPMLVIDDDGNFTTVYDQNTIESFQSEHYSWPVNVSADLVVLPLPPSANYDDVGATRIGTLWDPIDTTGKVVLIGREIRFAHARGWLETFNNKLGVQPPSAIIFTWWYDWMSFVPDFFNSVGGRRFSPLWDLGIAVGFVGYYEGSWIRNRESAINVSARVVIDSTIDTKSHFNVVGKLEGHEAPEKSVVIFGHYDTVMCAGFCDNGAGTAGVIELAQIFAEATKEDIYYPKYTMLFIGLASEELGAVGAVTYVMQHKAEMKDIVALVNLDCIGTDELCITESNPIVGCEFDELFLEAASDLEISATWTDVGGADDRVFADPVWGNNIYMRWWGLNAGIEDAVPVKFSIAPYSRPYDFYQEWEIGAPGWIHTSYDNSTSTETLSWVEAEDLENDIKVTALTLIRIPLFLPTDLNKDGTVNLQDVFILARAFGARYNETDGLYWHDKQCKYCPHDPAIDMDGSTSIDLKDVFKIARDYGKTT